MSRSKGVGRVHVITGPGKGKTTAAFGLAMRAAGHGLRVCIIQFMKTGEVTGEVLAAKRLGGIEVAQFGTGRFVDERHVTDEDRKCALDALYRAKMVISGGQCDLLVLDEVNVAVSFGLVSAQGVLDMIKSRPREMEVVLTGRNAPQEFLDYADYVSVVESKKHPFASGVQARKGIEW